MSRKFCLALLTFTFTTVMFLLPSLIITAYSATDPDTGYEIVYATTKTNFSTPCDSIWSRCADVKVNGSDGPMTFISPASYKVYALSQDGVLIGANCFLYNPVTSITVKVIESSDLTDINGAEWYEQSVNNVGPGQYKHRFYCEIYGNRGTFEDAVDVCVYDPAEGGCGVPAPGPVPSPYPNTSVSLTANPTNLTLPAGGGSVQTDLTAIVKCNVKGNINYTFYCNRSDAGINITSGYVSKLDNVEPTGWETTRGARCFYSSPGVYTAKVIAEQANNVVEDRVKITVNPGPSPGPGQTLSVNLTANPASITAGQNTSLTADIDISSTAQGTIHYQFDCTNNGSYEVDVTNNTDPYSTNSCGYSSAGTYTARVHVERGSAPSAEDTISIIVKPSNTLPTGYHDGVDNGNCRTWGWAYDPDTPSSSIDVHIYRDGPAGGGGTILNSFVANVFRPDVNTKKGITGNHGFDVNLSPYIADGKNHSLYVYPIDTTTNLGSPSNPLSDTPRTIQCSSPAPIPGKTPPSVDIKVQ